MKLFLIKLGKAFNVFKRDGLIRGARNILERLFVFAKSFFQAKSGDILFITGGVGDSARYRCRHAAEELGIHGFKCSVIVQDNPFLPGYADNFKVFIFHRVIYTDGVGKLIKKIKNQKKEIIFETDDLTFDPKYIKQTDHYRNMNWLERKQYENGLGAEILNDPYVKVCTTTTSFLAGKLREYGKKVFIVPNKLSNKDLGVADVILSERKRVEPACPLRSEASRQGRESNADKIRSLGKARDDRAIHIGYFSGTISHNKDFATISGALFEILEKYPEVELLLVGPLDMESRLNKFKGRIKQLPYVPREKHFENISRVGINLAPLEIGNPFCEAKSELKFFEAGILGVPTVAAATRTFREAISGGIDGFTAETGEWKEKIEKLITDRKLRESMGNNAKIKTLENYTNERSHNGEYYFFLKSLLG